MNNGGTTKSQKEEECTCVGAYEVCKNEYQLVFVGILVELWIIGIFGFDWTENFL